MPRWRSLNPRQLAVLRRIGEGRAPVTSREPALAPTVYALRGRRLVTAARANGEWTARITDAGRYYLEHGRYQQDDQSPPRSRGGEEPAGSGRPRVPKPHSHPAGGGPARSPVPDAGQLLALLAANDDVVRVRPSAEDRAAWLRAVDALRSSDRVPVGQRVHYRSHPEGELVVSLVSARPGVPRLAVPARLEQTHPVVAAMRAQPEAAGLSADAATRAARLAQALVTEAERRGYAVGCPQPGRPGLLVTVRGREFRLVLTEEWDTAQRLPNAEELDERGAFDWERVKRTRRPLATGRLCLTVVDDRYAESYGRRRWADGARTRLEDRLGEALAEVEDRVAEEDAEIRAATSAAQRRRTRWQTAMT